MHKTFFYFSVLLATYSNLSAQGTAGQLVCNIKEQKMARVNINQPVHYKDDNHQSNFPALVNELSFRGLAMQFIKPAATPATFFLSGTTIVAPNLVNVQNGWFCQQEWKFEKTTRLPLKLRLGSMDAVDYLEGKHIRR